MDREAMSQRLVTWPTHDSCDHEQCCEAPLPLTQPSARQLNGLAAVGSIPAPRPARRPTHCRPKRPPGVAPPPVPVLTTSSNLPWQWPQTL